MHDLLRRNGTAALALQFTVLTAARAGEVFAMTWAGVDPGARVGTIPGHRMKSGRQHRVPLSDQALAILREVMPSNPVKDRYVFAGNQPGRPLSNMSMLALTKRMNCEREVTKHKPRG